MDVVAEGGLEAGLGEQPVDDVARRRPVVDAQELGAALLLAPDDRQLAAQVVLVLGLEAAQAALVGARQAAEVVARDLVDAPGRQCLVAHHHREQLVGGGGEAQGVPPSLGEGAGAETIYNLCATESIPNSQRDAAAEEVAPAGAAQVAGCGHRALRGRPAGPLWTRRVNSRRPGAPRDRAATDSATS